jgi:hypothetical protein
MAKCDYTYLTVNAEIAHPICQWRRIWAKIRRALFGGDHEPACHYPAYEGDISEPADVEIGMAILLLAPKRIVEIDVTKVSGNQVAFSLKNPSDASLITFPRAY